MKVYLSKEKKSRNFSQLIIKNAQRKTAPLTINKFLQIQVNWRLGSRVQFQRHLENQGATISQEFLVTFSSKKASDKGCTHHARGTM